MKLDKNDRVFARVGDTVYWQCGSKVRRGEIGEDGEVSTDDSFSYNRFNDERLFGVDASNRIYWQGDSERRAGHVLLRGTIADNKLTIDRDYECRAFSQSDRLFAVNGGGDVVYWQDDNGVKRGTVASGNLVIHEGFSCDAFSRDDLLISAAGNKVCWLDGLRFKVGVIVDSSLSVTTDQLIDNISGSKTPNERIWALAGGAVGAYLSQGIEGFFSGVRLGAEAGRAAHKVEKTVRKLNPCK